MRLGKAFLGVGGEITPESRRFSLNPTSPTEDENRAVRKFFGGLGGRFWT
jgi:hypothetical protein